MKHRVFRFYGYFLRPSQNRKFWSDQSCLYVMETYNKKQESHTKSEKIVSNEVTGLQAGGY
uniref:Uncharacterized protein n=1 Tax=mine drainage metagenome TaxID=410659 RepID=E6QTG0_9ZZZZ